MKTSIEKITPQWATKVLEGNTHNRKFSSATAMKYAREMTEGRWRPNGESIIISKNNRLLDGQHRLFAVLESGVTIESVVVRDVEDDYFSTIDTGTGRKGKDVLSIEKVANPHVAAAVIGLTLRSQRNPNLMTTKLHTSNEEILEFYKENSALVDAACTLASRAKLRSLIPSTPVGFLYVVCADLKERVEQFFLALESGAGLEQTSPIWVLRERLQRDKSGKSRTRTEITTALMIKAWNAWVTGRTMTKISFAHDKEGYPLPVTTARQLNKAITQRD